MSHSLAAALLQPLLHICIYLFTVQGASSTQSPQLYVALLKKQSAEDLVYFMGCPSGHVTVDSMLDMPNAKQTILMHADYTQAIPRSGAFISSLPTCVVCTLYCVQVTRAVISAACSP